MNASIPAPFFEVFEPQTYIMKEPIIHDSMDSEELLSRFELPRRPKSILRAYESILDKFKQKFLPLDIYKVTDMDGSILICEELKYNSEEEVKQLSILLRTVRRHENLLDFKEIHIFKKERKFWLLSSDTNLQFVKKKLNKETKSPFSLYTIMKFYRDIEAALEHLSKVKDNQISIFRDVMLPMISTTGILFSAEDITFKIGLSMAFSAYWEQHESRYTHLDIQNALKTHNSCELLRNHKENCIVYSLGMVFLELTTGYFSELVSDKIKISEGPYSKDPIEVSKLRDVLFDVRKEQMFAMNAEQLKYMDKYHFPVVIGMISKPEWSQIIGQRYFARRIWSYRFDPTKLSLDPEPDWPFNSYLSKQDLNSNLLVDGINSTIFLHYFYLTGEALTGDKYRKLIKDEDKVSSFLNDIKEKLNLRLTEPASQESTNYSLEKCLDVDPSAQEPRKILKSEIIAIFKKNCIVHKCWLDILTLSVEFGDDLNHLSSVIATTFPYMSTEIDENRRIVFRIANTMSPGDRVVDIMLDTLDIMIITVNCIRLKFDECIKGERFGRLSKSSSFVVEEIIEKIKEYKDVKQEIILRHSKNMLSN